VKLLALVAFVVAIPLAHAQDTAVQNYKVKPNDTLELIAAEYYGDRNHAIFIMVENKMTHPRPLKPGERLKIPVTREITTVPSDTFQTLADKYLGNPRRASFLADFNHKGVDDSLPAGTPLTIPFHVTHTAQNTETLASIAAAYTGDPKNADLLRLYNFLDRDAIDKGESIVVPIYNVAVKPAKLPPIDADASSRRQKQQAAMATAATALPAARVAWRAGNYEEIEHQLVDLESSDRDYLPMPVASEIGILLGCAYVAFGNDAAAMAAFQHVRERDRAVKLDRYHYSPKILEVWEKVDGKVD